MTALRLKDLYKLQHDIKEALFWMESAYKSSPPQKEKWDVYFLKGKKRIEERIHELIKKGGENESKSKIT